jgi:serine/threonine protein kinase
MTTLTRSQLLPFFDLRREIKFAQNLQTHIVRAYDASDNAALVEKKYSGILSNLQVRENELLFAVAQREVGGVQLTSRIAALRSYSKQSVQGNHEILVKWYGFDLEDWYTLLSGTPGNPFHQAHFLLELVRAALKALYLLHAAGFVHCDVHNGNWCLPFTDAALEPDGSALRCTLNPDALKLIDLGLSLKPAAERGLPPRLYNAAGGVGEIITLNDRATPAHPRRLVDALDRARLGDVDPWLALDWRLDVWRLGALIDVWRDAAGKADGLTGAKPLRVLLADLADALKKPEQDALAGAAVPIKLPHEDWVQTITDAISEPQLMEVSLPLQTDEAKALAALVPVAGLAQPSTPALQPMPKLAHAKGTPWQRIAVWWTCLPEGIQDALSVVLLLAAYALVGLPFFALPMVQGMAIIPQIWGWDYGWMNVVPLLVVALALLYAGFFFEKTQMLGA